MTAIAELIKKNQPFVLRQHETALSCYNWRDTFYLEKHFGSKKLEVDYYPLSYADFDSAETLPLTFAEFIKIITEEDKRKLYLELELVDHKSSRYFPSLNSDVTEIFYQANIASRTLLIGKNAQTHMHYHRYYDSLLWQIHGNKIVFLFPPDFFYQMKPYPWYSKFSHWSRLRFNSETAQEFEEKASRLSLKAGLKFCLKPGDALHIPIYWWHIVFGEGLSMSLVDFFPAKLKNTFITYLGLRSLNHVKYVKNFFLD